MANAIPGTYGLQRAGYTIQIIDKCLPSKGTIRHPSGMTDQVRFTLTHSALRPRMRKMGKRKPIVAAAFEAVPKTQLGKKESFHGHPVNVGDVQVLVPLLGNDIKLSQKDRQLTPVTYVTTLEEVISLAKAISAAMP